MTNIVIKRTNESEYKLQIDGSIVQTYNQTKMVHPWDWAEDAKANGATNTDIRRHNYDYVDDR